MGKIFAVIATLVLVSACYNSGSKLREENVSKLEQAVTNNVAANAGQVTSTAATTSSAVSRAAQK